MPRQPDLDPVLLRAVIRRILPGDSFRFQRTESGVSTPVYRVWYDDAVYYLRIAEDSQLSLAPEVFLLGLLGERGVKVPEVLYFEPFNETLQRSIMLTGEIRGQSLAEHGLDSDPGAILQAAGRDPAIINDVAVDGFGWIRRNKGEVTALEADHPTNRAFLLEHWDADLLLLERTILSRQEIEALCTIVQRLDTLLDVGQSLLAHGDLDVTHIYQSNGVYMGIIDFGEIRGAGAFYDLGHFNLHDGEALAERVLPDLLAGYREVSSMSADYELQIQFMSLLIGVRTLAHGVGRWPAVHRQRVAGWVCELLAALRE
ncbi:MAG: aminoglycoside phosphotransferase family protein [Dehalococcoidia bacterium]